MEAEVPSGWEKSKLGKHFERIRRKNSAGVQRALTVSGADGLVDQKEFFDRRVASKNLDNYLHLMRGEFAFNRSSMQGYPFGAIKRLDRYKEGVVSTLYISFGLRPSARLSSDFAAHLFESRQLDRELSKITSVGARAHGLLNVKPREFFDVSFLLPPLSEQQKIAAILTSVDDAIASTRKVIEQTKRVKNGLLQTLMTRGIGHTRFKTTEIGEIPEEWEVHQLSEICERISVGIASSATHAYVEEGVPLIRNQNIGHGRLLLDDLLYVTQELDAQYESKRLEAGDVVAMRTGEPGRSAVIPEALHGAQTFTTLIFRPGPRLVGAFLNECMNSPIGQRQVSAFQAGGAQSNLNVRVAKQIRIPLPSREEQHRIVHRVNAIRELEKGLRSEMSGLHRLKRGLMQDLLTGRVRVQPD